jgi:hypothetical protein
VSRYLKELGACDRLQRPDTAQLGQLVILAGLISWATVSSSRHGPLYVFSTTLSPPLWVASDSPTPHYYCSCGVKFLKKGLLRCPGRLVGVVWGGGIESTGHYCTDLKGTREVQERYNPK